MKTAKDNSCKQVGHNFFKVSEDKVVCTKCGEVRKF